MQRNAIIAFVEHVISRALALKSGGKAKFVVERSGGTPLVYESIEKLKEDDGADIVRLTPLATSALRIHIHANHYAAHPSTS